MTALPDAQPFAPPLRHCWRSTATLATAVAGSSALYGITGGGTLVILNNSTGAVRWESQDSYVTNRLTRQGSRLFAYRLNQGLAYIDDDGTSVTETLAMSFGVTKTTSVSAPAVDGDTLVFAVNQGLYYVHQQQGFKYGAILDETTPHMVGIPTAGQVIVLDGNGLPTMYRFGSTGFEVVWRGEPHGLETGRKPRPFVFVGNRVVVAVGDQLIAYALSTGRIDWRAYNTPATALATGGGVVFAGTFGAELWALQAATGQLLWTRKYMYNSNLHLEHGIAVAGDYLYYGAAMNTNPDRSVLLAVQINDGSFAWMSRAGTGPWSGGLPVVEGDQIYCYSSAHTGLYCALSEPPRVTSAMLAITPQPITGPAASFEQGTFSVTLPVSAQLSARVYRERLGVGRAIVDSTNWTPGRHETSWTIGGSGGFDDTNQFGYVLLDIAESGGATYTHAILLPVNSFPDIQRHWACGNIEIMIFNKFVNGYPDQTFKPDNLVTRAESSTIIAKTLNLRGPSPGFRSKFTDLAGHWARDYIAALEERGVVGGFSEPDGTFTFRPDLNMTRGQKARILVQAYGITPAPNGFASKFVDIRGHWAEADIKALEAAGFVSGYQESDGTVTYRPDQNLTRAELCTLVVRIRGLSH